jgi:nitrogen fixation protein NifU and related proteins
VTRKEKIQKNQEELKNNPELDKMSAEVLDHMVNPKNYGEMQFPSGVGQAVSPKSNEFANIYIKVESDTITDISFGCRSCQDTTVAGSIFTTMVKGLSVQESLEIMKQMEEQIQVAPKKQQIASRMILKAFESAVQNMENRKTMLDQEIVSVEL